MDGRDLLLHELRTVPPQSSMIKFPDFVFETTGTEVFNEMGNSEGAPDLKFETSGEGIGARLCFDRGDIGRWRLNLIFLGHG